ncbi:MAG TPA: hypothetical protein VIY53_10570 [Acidobacteriaceae bacterium]
MALNAGDAVSQDGNVEAAGDGAQAIAECGAVDMERFDLDAPWLLREPRTRSVIARATILGANDDVLLIDRDAFIE